MSDTFFDSIIQQPRALRDLAGDLPVTLLRSIPSLGPTPLLTGMGASYHAASIAAQTLHAAGIPVLCMQATDLLFYNRALLKPGATLIFVSQSGASAEVRPIIEQLPAGVRLVAVVNDVASLLARRADVVLPMTAGAEYWVATKTYTNALAVLWLLTRQITGALDGAEGNTLEALAGEVEHTLTRASLIAAQWIEALGRVPHLVFLGHGPQAVTARQAAMVVNEWAKVPAAAYGAGAFRHGFIEQVRDGSGAILFAMPGPACESTRQLAGELASYGARVLVVEQGHARAPSEAPFSGDSVTTAHPTLSAVLDILPAQLFAEALARHLGVEYGFRHIGKVVTRL